MKYGKVDMRGHFFAPNQATKPSWSLEDTRRVIYVEDERMLYYATDEGWVKSSGTGFNPVYVSEDYVAEEQDLCLVDTRNGPVTITVPASPKDGGEIKIVDTCGTFESNPCTIARNGNEIQRHEKNLVVDINDVNMVITFDKLGANGWKVELTGVSQVVGHATLFVNTIEITAQDIDGEGGQKQFTLPFKYNTTKDNVSVFVSDPAEPNKKMKRTDFTKTNPTSVTFFESVPAGSIVEVTSIPIEAGYNIDKFVTVNDLEMMVTQDDFTDAKVMSKIQAVDGPGSGLDADTVDGRQADEFLLASSFTDGTVMGMIQNVDGPGSGLDADTVDSFHAAQTVTETVETRQNNIPVARADGTIDPLWIPFGRGAMEVVSSFDIPGGTAAVDVAVDLDSPAGYIIYVRNVRPEENDVELRMKWNNMTSGAFDVIPSWSVTYSTHLAGPLRDFNTNSDMLVADRIGNTGYGVNGSMLIRGFGPYDNAKTVRTDFHYLSSIDDYAAMYEGVAAAPATGDRYDGVRLYFSTGNFQAGGKVVLMKINETSE